MANLSDGLCAACGTLLPQFPHEYSYRHGPGAWHTMAFCGTCQAVIDVSLLESIARAVAAEARTKAKPIQHHQPPARPTAAQVRAIEARAAKHWRHAPSQKDDRT
jgi:hypothetical protein